MYPLFSFLLYFTIFIIIIDIYYQLFIYEHLYNNDLLIQIANLVLSYSHYKVYIYYSSLFKNIQSIMDIQLKLLMIDEDVIFD